MEEQCFLIKCFLNHGAVIRMADTEWIEIGRVVGDTGPKGDTGDIGIGTVVKGHYSSYVVRHTFCFHFVGVAMDDSKFNEISRRERATMLLSKYLNHSSTKITIDYYMRFENKAISGIVFELNLGKEAVDMIVDKYNKVKKDCGEQMCLL